MSTTAADSPLVSFGRRLGRHTAIYAASSVAAFVFGIVNVAALTRMLPIEEFGRLALYLLLATLLTTLYNLGSLQGILICVFGVAEGEEEMALDEVEGERVREVDRERALTTGVLLTAAIAVAGTLAVFAAAPLVAKLLPAHGELEAVRLAAVCGATGAVWRLVHNVARLERRPGVYTALSLVRPVLALGLGVAFVAAGFGVEGALAGVALGTALAVPIGIAAERRSYAFGLELGIVPEVFRRGAFVVPMILSMWIVTNADLFLVSAYAPSDELGPYRVASRLGAGVSYLVSALSMAWLPLRRTPLHTAVREEHGPSRFGGTVLTAFLLVCIWVVLGLALLADVLIRIAPESYAGAAPLVPLIGLGIVASGVLLVVYRGAKLPNRQRTYIGLLLGATAVFAVAGMVLVPRYGGYGAAIAQILAFVAAAAAMLWLVQRSKHPLPIRYGRLARGVVLGLFCIALGQLLAPLADDWRLAVDLLILAAFPALLVLARAFPAEELHVFVDVSRSGGSRRRSSDLVAKLEELDADDRRVVALIAPKGGSPERAAQALGTSQEETMTRFVASLRALGPDGNGGPDDKDLEIATYLVGNLGVATRDHLGERLCEEGVDPLDLDVLEVALERLRRMPRDEWERLGC